MSQLVVNILDSFLGESRRHNIDSGQLQYDCPACAVDKGIASDGKGNLEINYQKGVFRCWACYDTNNMHGSVIKLIKNYGNATNLRDYALINPSQFKDKDDIKEVEIFDLPEGYVELHSCDKTLFRYSQAMYYLRKRGITAEMIEKYKIGFTTIGKYANRIIIPSYNTNNELDFFVGRAFLEWVKPKYLNPDLKKTLIHFNESKINWDATIYIVEGVTDGIVIPNSIPILGKVMSEKLFYDLQFRASGMVVIVLDGDAIAEAEQLYKKLNTLNLHNRVKIVKLHEDWDLSKINEKYGRTEIVKTLKSAHKIPESRL